MLYSSHMIDQQEIVQEIKLYREIDSHENIINFCGITNKENHNDQAKEYLLVMEDVDGIIHGDLNSERRL
ncbi:unnamed protein product [Rhizophagus irregularis]|nr:unnamed protein product [Rhizophagus irregularis]CAB5336513.1 unnamed protein product [Rhizophagus irregularis]